MTSLEFVASLIESLAWPLVVLVAVWILRKPLGQLIPLLEKLKYKDLELDFSRRLEEAREVTAALPPAGREEIAAGESEAARLAAVSPRAAILEAWRVLESAILTAAHSLGESFSQQGRPLLVSAITALERSGMIDRGLGDVLDDFRQLRNAAAHAPDFAVPVSEAISYVHMSEQLARVLHDRAGDA